MRTILRPKRALVFDKVIKIKTMVQQLSFSIFVIRTALVLSFVAILSLAAPLDARAQTVADGSDAAIGKASAGVILDLVGQRFKGLDPKVTSLRKAEGSWICGSVDAKNRDGLYIGERGFVVDLSDAFFGRVPDGPELLNPRAEGFQSMERIRQLYFTMCLD